jgi:valyl-tRNA synthetase
MTAMTRIPEKATVDGLDDRWNETWENEGTYRFDPSQPRETVYSIDTPPPTVSGSLHVGHVFSYTHTDLVDRYQRMRGKDVFYPMGWDDNGLPTERRVQNFYGVRCDPSLPYEEDFTPPHGFDQDGGGEGKSIKQADQVPISRRNFIELCERLTEEDEKQFEALWRHLGLSVDWSRTYQTISPEAQAVAQQAFLRNVERGEAYQAEAPTLWDVTFRTAVAQAELEEKERDGAFHSLTFHREGADPVVIETTRPELLPACVALVAHPDDKRYQPLFGSTVTTPLFGVEVPVVSHYLADPEKGSGIAMICTFGDVTDVTWWRELQLPTRAVLGFDGRFMAEAPSGVESEAGLAAYAELAGKTVFSAQKRIVELLAESGEMLGDPKPVTHPVKFFEKGDKPLEIVTTRQWYIANGGRDEKLRDALLARGSELGWTPEFMRVRFDNWVNGLNGDWLISRQRFFGVPLPVWYPVTDAGDVDHDHPIFPGEDALPVDPSSQPAPGYQENQRGKPGGFVGDADVMDTWATSSLTPQIACGWREDPDLFARTFPMDLRPQAQDIIRTWLFSTVLRAHTEHGTLPWAHAAISGFIVDPDRKKMSKSKGNVVTPMGLLHEHGPDAVRYWAASARLGTDAAFDTGQMKIGRRLAMKVLNASKFVLGVTGIEAAANASLDEGLKAAAHVTAANVTERLDRALLAALAQVIEEATAAYEAFDHTRALEVTERFFWAFTDDYLELVKDRAYAGTQPGEPVDAYADLSDDARSARATLTIALEAFLLLFAPVLPFSTEEVWNWWREGSVHRSPWPVARPLREACGANDAAASAEGANLLVAAGSALAALRKIKSEAKVSQRTEIATVELLVPESQVRYVEAAEAELKAAGRVRDLAIVGVPDGGDAVIATRGAELVPAK